MSFWQNRHTLVTGATGLLGSHLVEELLARGAAVTCLVRDHVPRSRLLTSGLIDRVNVVRGELEDFQLLLRAINEHEIESVFAPLDLHDRLRLRPCKPLRHNMPTARECRSTASAASRIAAS